MAAGAITNKKSVSMNGVDVDFLTVELEGTETTAVTVATGFREVLNVQISIKAGGTPTEASTFFWSVSGGTITIDSTHALTGTNYASVMVVGYRG